MTASICQSHSAKYYFAQVDYLLSDERGGQWFGEGAERLGFTGIISQDELVAAYEGLNADRSRQLVQRLKSRARQSGWDLTFSAPKSVSVLWSISNEYYREKIESCLIAAAKMGLKYVDAEAIFTRRGKEGRYVEHARGVYALFPHFTSRALDPQLHVHSVVVNMCLRQDGTTGAIRSRDLYLHKMAAGAIFRLELAYLLRKELGLEVVKDDWKFKLAAIPDALSRSKSKRRAELEALAAEYGLSSPRVLAKLAIDTRRPKQHVTLADCLPQWEKDAEEFCLNSKAVEAIYAQGKSRIEAAALTANDQLIDVRPTIRTSVASLAQFKAHFPKRDIIRETAARLQDGSVSAETVIRVVESATARFENHLISQKSGYIHYSTRENIASEKELIERVERGRDATSHLISEAVVEEAKRRVERNLSRACRQRVTLTTDQSGALRHATLVPGDTIAIQGYAGTGKTQFLEAANYAWTKSGMRVIGTAITGRAALGLQQATGIPSFTVDLLLKQLRPELTAKELLKIAAWKVKGAARAEYYRAKEAGEWLRNPWKQVLKEIGRKLTGQSKVRRGDWRSLCRLTKDTILVVDEAAMLPTATLLALKAECDKVGAKLVLVGDRLQIPPIEAGGPFWSIAKRIGHASLTTLVRQRRPWMREAVTALINDEPRRALQIYADNGALRLDRNKQSSIKRLVDDFLKLSPKQLPRSLALANTNEEARAINQAIQTHRRHRQQLGWNSIRLPNGERVHKHDRIIFTANHYGINLRNGVFATVVGVHRTRGIMGPGSLTVKLDGVDRKGLFARSSPTLVIDLKKYQDVQLGYATTTHKVQSITVENAFVLLSDSMPSKERAFTQLTRASHSNVLYATKAKYGDTLGILADELKRETAKDLAHDHTLVTRNLKHDQSQSL